MSNYPLILVPNPIKKAQITRIESEDNQLQSTKTTEALPKKSLVKFNSEGKPIKPQLKGTHWLIIEAVTVSAISAAISIFYNKPIALTILVLGFIGTVGHTIIIGTQFQARWQAYLGALKEAEAAGADRKEKSATAIAKERKDQADKQAQLEAKERARLMREVLQQTVTADGHDSAARRGRSEPGFELHLRAHFQKLIYTGLTCSIPNFAIPYTPDFALIEPSSGLHLDIEIDEPYNAEGEPVHYLGLDDNRNKFFVERNWVVVRFAEEQVIRYPDACCKLIAQVVASILGTPKGSPQAIALENLAHVGPVPKVRRWSKKEAAAMAKRKHRGTY